MRAAGMSIWQVTVAVLKAALFVILIVTLVGETIVPHMASLANDQKFQAMSEGKALRTAKGVWLRSGNNFITIGAVSPDNTLRDVYQFHFDTSYRMQFARKIKEIQFQGGQWIAYDIAESNITTDNSIARHYKKKVWDVSLKPRLLQVGGSEPDEMTLHELRQYLRMQKKNHQEVQNYQLAYWQRLLQPLTTVIMMVLAIPFIFGPLRSSTMGSKLLAGATVGFGFHIINRIFGPISQVFQLPVEIAAFGPTFLFALLGIYLMRRVR